MKKALTVFLIAIVAVTGVFAATDVDLAINLKSNFFEFGFSAKDNDTKFETPKIGLDIDGTFIFDRHNGFYIDLGFNMKEGNTFTVAGGYAYTEPLSNTMDLVLGIGPHFKIRSNSFDIGADFNCDFKMDMTQKMFFRFGLGVDMNFATIAKGNSMGYFDMQFVIPRVAIGWDF